MLTEVGLMVCVDQTKPQTGIKLLLFTNDLKNNDKWDRLDQLIVCVDRYFANRHFKHQI